MRSAQPGLGVDYKGQFRLGNGELCYPLTPTDNCSRYPVRLSDEANGEGIKVRLIRHNDEIKAGGRPFKRALIALPNAWPKTDRIGLIETACGEWEVRYGFYLLGFLHESIGKLERDRAWHGNR